MLTVTVLFLGGMYQGWQNTLNDALENTHIDGMVVSLNGRYYSGLVLSEDDVRLLLSTEGVDSVSVSFGYHYWVPEDMPSFTSGEHASAHRQEWIEKHGEDPENPWMDDTPPEDIRGELYDLNPKMLNYGDYTILVFEDNEEMRRLGQTLLDEKKDRFLSMELV